MSVFAARGTTYLQNTAIFCNPVKKRQNPDDALYPHMLNLKFLTKHTWALYLFNAAFCKQTYFLGGLSSEKCYLGYFKICVDQANVNSNLFNRSHDKSCALR